MNGGQRSTFVVEKKPYDYQVEWIGTDGNVLFNTGFVPNTYDITIKAKMYYVGFTNNTSWPAWFAAYTDENASTYRIIRNGTSNTAVLMYNGRKAGGGGVSCNVTQNTLYNIEFTPTQLKLNNFSSNFTKSGNVNTATMKIFSTQFKGRMYYFQMYKNGELVVDLIPVVKDNVGCVYDRVSKILLYNTLTGTVLIGPTL